MFFPTSTTWAMNPSVDELGIGLICFPGMETVVQSLSGYIDLIEIEPQTSWFTESPESDSFRFDPQFAAALVAMPQPKVFHGVGFPIGSTLLPPKSHFETLNAHIRAVKPIYTSEHLSFNRYCNTEGHVHQTNFLLPPLQNQKGVETAVRGIHHYKQQTGKPFAFETGVNYLHCRPGEMEDGEFIARIAEESDAYILLDLHNLLANQLNGRQSVSDLLQQLPAERIIEIHLAGGSWYQDYYLDAHSGVSSPELLALTDTIVRDLPCLKSIVFEVLPDYFGQGFTESDLRRQLTAMKKIWDHRNATATHHRRYERTKSRRPVDNSLIPEVWEFALGNIANSGSAEDIPLQHELLQDPAIPIIRNLIFEFRASMLVSGLKMTCRLVKLQIGTERFHQLLKEYCATNESAIFGYASALRFARFLEEQQLDIPYLQGMLDFELSAAQTCMDGKIRTLHLSFDPFLLLDHLVQWKNPIPPSSSTVLYQVEIHPDAPIADRDALLRFNAVAHM